ncbi:carboxyltransferase domain-containing protein [Streptomyces sp. AC627_RSS907]|uniref:carboxyltransferase domain-containing protein n=1 Tax=Streptomyces sp. AC627_RSS907 TaxID=2823684 RepID=UPI001C219632|nr:carboxyltransferase domain-containing protein [Streptomyces sp. AC627_RSS907]
MTSIDLDADLGEGFGHGRLTVDEGLPPVVTSAGAARGFHAGGPATVRRVCEPAAERGVCVGARVSYRDLADVAAHWGVAREEAGRIHAGAELHVAFRGFAPGFGHLTGLPARYDVPRRATPRTAVAAGSVAPAGPSTGGYPRSSPGGRQLIGTTDAVLWDRTRVPAALLSRGTRVRFVPRGARRCA